MIYVNVDKKISTRSEANETHVRNYINSHLVGHRVFNGNFDGVDVVKLLMMLGCSFDYKVNNNGKLATYITHFHAYEEDTEAMLSLIDLLE